VREFARRFLVIAAALTFYTLFNSQGFASDQSFRMNPGERERIIHSTDELPNLWLTEIHRSVDEMLLASMLKLDNVKAYSFHQNKILLKLQIEGPMVSSRIYMSRGRTLEQAHFAALEASGEFNVSDRLRFVDVDAKNERLVSTGCSDAPPFGCGRSTYHCDGRTFLIEKVEGKMELDGPWIPAWTATPIIPPK
jgi:hypothetical protein